jgi:hypothetical protein
MRRSRAPPVALDASRCPGGRGVDFIVDLPEFLMRRILMSLPGKQLARCQAVSTGWRNVCADEPSWARAYDNSYGSNPAEHLAQTSIGIAPMKRLIPFTKEELHPPGGGWRAAYARRFTASMRAETSNELAGELNPVEGEERRLRGGPRERGGPERAGAERRIVLRRQVRRSSLAIRHLASI